MLVAFLAAIVFYIFFHPHCNMIHPPLGNKITLFDPGSNIKYINPSINNLPAEIKSSQQFCFWKYVYVKNDSKTLKVPYGYSLENKSLVPSLKNKKH